MPVPNDFRLSGALGGLVASQEYQAEQERQALQNLQTQTQTASTQQQTSQAAQLLPFLLQQREQENQIRAKQALEAQLGMGNVPLEQQLSGMQTQGKINSFAGEQELAGKERTGKGMALDQANQLSALRKVHYIMQTQGPLAASSVAGELGMNPKVLMENPEMIPRAISMIENQMMSTPQHLGKMQEKELDTVTDLEKARIGVGPQYARIAAEKEWRKEALAAKADTEKKALDIQKDYVKARNEWLNSGQPTSGPVFDKYEAAHNDYWTSQTYRQPSNSYLDFETGDIRRETPQNRPIPPLINRPNAGSGGGGNPTGGSGGNQMLSPEQRAELIRRLKESK